MAKPGIMTLGLSALTTLATATAVAAQMAPEGYTRVDTAIGPALAEPSLPDIAFQIRPMAAGASDAARQTAFAAIKTSLANICPELADQTPRFEMGGEIFILDSPDPTSACGTFQMTRLNGLVVVISENPISDPAMGEAVGQRAMELLMQYNIDPFELPADTFGAADTPAVSTPDTTTRTEVRRPGQVQMTTETRFEPRQRVDLSDTEAIEGELKAAIASVKAQNRPIGNYLHGMGSYVGYPPAYTYMTIMHPIFANGYMTDCADFDPRKLDPTPGSLGQIEDCSVAPWRKTPSGEFEYRDDDGDWMSMPAVMFDTDDSYVDFRPGERIDLRFGNVSGASFDYGFSGVSTSRVDDGTLYLDQSGKIITGRSVSTVISGDAVVGNGENWTRLVGRYRLDGHLVAIYTESSEIVVGFIDASKDEAGAFDHVYFLGEHFWANN